MKLSEFDVAIQTAMDTTYSKDEKSLILFFETCLVDNYGRVDSRHMSEKDFKIARKMSEKRLIQFGRLLWDVVEASAGSNHRNSNWVRFSDEAWKLAHQWRKERADRMLSRHIKKLDAEMTCNKNKL